MSHRCALPSHLQPSPGPTYAFLPLHLQSPLQLSQHLSAAPSNVSEQPAELAGSFLPSQQPRLTGWDLGRAVGRMPSQAPIPGRGEDSAQLLPTEKTQFPRSPPAELSLTAAASCGLGRGAARRGTAANNPPPAPAAAGLCPPAGAAPGSGAERGRGGGCGPAPPGKFLPARRRVLPRRPRLGTLPAVTPAAAPVPSPGLALANVRAEPPRTNSLPGANVLRPPGCRRVLQCAPSSCHPWASWRYALPPAPAGGVSQLLIAPARGPALLCPATGAFIHGPGLGGERGITKAGDRLPGRPEDPAPWSLSASFSTSVERRRRLPLPLGESVSST